MKARDEAELAWIEGIFVEEDKDSKNGVESMEIELYSNEAGDRIPCLEPLPTVRVVRKKVFTFSCETLGLDWFDFCGLVICNRNIPAIVIILYL